MSNPSTYFKSRGVSTDSIALKKMKRELKSASALSKISLEDKV